MDVLLNAAPASFPPAPFVPGTDDAPRDAAPTRPVRVRKPGRRGRSLKISAAVAFLLAIAYGLLAQTAYVASDQAIVSAAAVSLRAPIAGTLTESWLTTGATVVGGGPVGHLRNDAVDGERLQELHQRAARARAERGAILAEQSALRGLQEELLRRARMHDSVASLVLGGQVTEAARLLDARLVQGGQQAREAERRSTLERAGFAAHAEADRQRAAAAGAGQEAEAQRARVLALQTQQAAAQRGVMIDSSGADVTYSTQRADELTIRLAELDRALAQQTAEVGALEDSLAAETRRVARLSDSPLLAPATGIVWKMGASDGERVGVGDEVAQIVDCRAAFLLVGVPQDRLSHIVVGTEIRFRLGGESLDRVGRVASVSGESSGAADRTLAARLPPATVPTGTLRVALASRNEPSDCLVGRTAHVLIPAGGDDWLRRLGRLVF